MSIKRVCMALGFVLAVVAGQSAMAQEYTGHYSGPMDVDSHSVTRVNDGSGEMVLLEELDQSTVHNVLRKATRPEAADLVWEMIEKGNIGYAPKDLPEQRSNVRRVPMTPETPEVPAGAGGAAEPRVNPMLMRGAGPQTMR